MRGSKRTAFKSRPTQQSGSRGGINNCAKLWTSEYGEWNSSYIYRRGESVWKKSWGRGSTHLMQPRSGFEPRTPRAYCADALPTSSYRGRLIDNRNTLYNSVTCMSSIDCRSSGEKLRQWFAQVGSKGESSCTNPQVWHSWEKNVQLWSGFELRTSGLPCRHSTKPAGYDNHYMYKQCPVITGLSCLFAVS